MARGTSKAQAIPLDFAFGLFIFLLLLAYFLVQWNLFTTRFAARTLTGNMDVEAISVSEMLVHTPGSPQNWTAAPLTAQSIGLAPRQNMLDSGRIAAFAALPYANAKQILGIDHDFLVTITTPDGATLAFIGQDANSTTAAEVTRLAVLNNTIVNVKVRIYAT